MAVTLWSQLGKVHDRRSRQGQRYSLRSILALSIAAVLGGCSSLGAIAQWIGEVARKGLLGEFGIERGRPCHATLHYVFSDLSFREDQCRVRTGSGPEALAALRNTAITLLRRLGYENVAAGLRHFMMNFTDAISLVRYGRIE